MITKLVNSLSSILAVSPDAAQACEKAADRLVNHNNSKLEANPCSSK